MGTTLLAMRYKDGVYVASDSQTSSGSYISNRAADKISPISDNIICLRAGSSADTQNIVDLVKNIILKEKIEREDQIEVRVVAQLLRNVCYMKKSTSNCGFICAGWDIFHGGQIYAIVQGGTLITIPFVSTGSGSIFLSSFCEANFKDNMNEKEIETLIIKAISFAIQKDANSSGFIRICKITEKGFFKRSVLPLKSPKY